MSNWMKSGVAFGISLMLGLGLAVVALANGGPFVIRYPEGDPSAKGVLARLDPDLKPRRETQLRVVKEDLKVAFSTAPFESGGPPLATVSAVYTIENPTAEDIDVDFGFPILRGIHINPYSMMPTPDVHVSFTEEGRKESGEAVAIPVSEVEPDLISNSAIYGIIRQRARETIDKAVAGDAALGKLVAAVRDSSGADRQAAREALAAHLTGRMKRNPRDAALMVEYASLEFGQAKGPLRGLLSGWPWFTRDEELRRLSTENLGPLAAIGEQKATQFFAQLASRFDPAAGETYESIFSAWGGDVRERAVDLKTGRVRPREITVDPKVFAPGPINTPERAVLLSDPTVTIYARVDYLDSNTSISADEKASCKEILKNLPVVFTFAPMNLLHYRVKFAPKRTRTLTVVYSQYPYLDTRAPASYQLAYVVHPASLWQHFGPINLEIAVPEGAAFRASARLAQAGVEERPIRRPGPEGTARFAIYRGVLKKKTGELFLAVESAAWPAPAPTPPRTPKTTTEAAR
jgi:hypothetical protein